MKNTKYKYGKYIFNFYEQTMADNRMNTAFKILNKQFLIEHTHGKDTMKFVFKKQVL